MTPPAPVGRPAYSVVVPAFNEERRIGATLVALCEYLRGLGRPAELVIVDDGSTDGTLALLRKAEQTAPPEVAIVVISYRPNRGKGAAVRAGCLAANGEYILFTDADLATPINEAAKLWQALDGGSDLAIGSRIQPDGSDLRASQPWYRRGLGRLYRRLQSALVLQGIADTQCGFKAFTRGAAQFVFSNQRIDGIVFDAEILFLAQRKGYRIAQIPVVWTNVGGSRMRVTLRQAWRVFRDLWSIRGAHRRLFLNGG